MYMYVHIYTMLYSECLETWYVTAAGTKRVVR